MGKLRGGAHLELRLSPIFDGAAAAPTVGSFVPLVVRTPAESGSRPRLPSSHVSLLSQDPNDLPADLVSDYMPPPVARRVITAAATPPVATATCSPACSKGVCCAAGGGAPKCVCDVGLSGETCSDRDTRLGVVDRLELAGIAGLAALDSAAELLVSRLEAPPTPPAAAAVCGEPDPRRRCAPRALCSSPRSSTRRGRPKRSPTSSSPSAT